jgi:hypothetical protein
MLSISRHNPRMSEDDDTPLDNLPSSGLASLWAVRSNLRHDREIAEIIAEKNGTVRPMNLLPWNTTREQERLAARHRREREQYEQSLRDLAARQDRLLERIEEQQAVIERERQDCEAHAIRLRDGRRVYVDGDRFRDGEGTIITGSDEAEAARQHEYRPDASTWAQKTDIDRRQAEAQRLHDEVMADKGAPPDEASARLTAEEKEFADQVEARQQAMNTPASAPHLPDYGNGNYMNDYTLSAQPAFAKAADPASRETIRKPTDTESDTAQIKKPPQPFGGGGMKLG